MNVSDDADFSEAVEVVVRCQEDPTARIRLSNRYFLDEYGIGFNIVTSADGLQASVEGVELWVWDQSLAEFVDKLAADFRGWSGERIWGTENLTLRAVVRSGGHVGLTWTLRPGTCRFNSWEASITTWLEAGEQMATLAADIRYFLQRENRAETR